MILVPGPHVLNGALDLIKGRIHLGAARLVYAGLVIVAISTGLLLGLALLGVSLPVDPSARALPLWQDVIAAGVAVAAYGHHYRSGNEPWPRHSEDRDRSSQREIRTTKIVGSEGHAHIRHEVRCEPFLAPPIR